MNIIHYVSSKNWDLLPFITTICNSCPVSSCRQRKTDASYERNVWKCGWLSFAATAPWSSMGKLGKTCYSEKQKISLPHPSSGRIIAAEKSGRSPSMEETSQNLAYPLPGRDTQFPVQQPYLEPSPRRQISSVG